MTRYLITYDLRKQRNYDDMYKAIKSYTKWAQVLESVWAVKSESSAEEIRDNLKQYMDGDDGLYVTESPRGAAWININCEKKILGELLE